MTTPAKPKGSPVEAIVAHAGGVGVILWHHGEALTYEIDAVGRNMDDHPFTAGIPDDDGIYLFRGGLWMERVRCGDYDEYETRYEGEWTLARYQDVVCAGLIMEFGGE